VNAFYKETHSVFDCSSISEAIALCRENLGDNNPYELLQKRKWFTFPGGELYIRKDCLDHSIITFFALKNHEQHR
jgi:hypothetical protein